MIHLASASLFAGLVLVAIGAATVAAVVLAVLVVRDAKKGQIW